MAEDCRAAPQLKGALKEKNKLGITNKKFKLHKYSGTERTKILADRKDVFRGVSALLKMAPRFKRQKISRRVAFLLKKNVDHRFKAF